MRKLVTVRRVDEVAPIPEADAIVRARIGGWDVVTKKGEFKEGDLCVYFEIDSFLPETDYRFQFLMKNKILWNGHHGARLKTIKLRGQISQGLALPCADFPEVMQEFDGTPQSQDFAELLNVLKWEPIIPAQLQGKIRGNFPHFIPKTDQERAQNIIKDIFDDLDRKYEVTMKLEGSSMTVYKNDSDFGVCSRNLSLKVEDEGNSFIRIAKKLELEKHLGNDYALQGELMGPGVQGNIEGFTELRYYVYDVWDIRNQRYLDTNERVEYMTNLMSVTPEINHVPIIGIFSLRELGIETIDDLISYADGPSINFKYREGLVFKAVDDPSFSFKVISNKYLMKT